MLVGQCAKCNKAVTDSDLSEGRGAQLGDQVLCENCAPEVGAQIITSPGLTGNAPASSVQNPAQPENRPAIPAPIPFDQVATPIQESELAKNTVSTQRKIVTGGAPPAAARETPQQKIHYCDQCGGRVNQSDIDAGKAKVVDEARTLCASCAPSARRRSSRHIVRGTRSPDSALRKESERRSAANAARSAPAHSGAAGSSSKTLLIVGGVVGLVILLGVVALVAGMGDEPDPVKSSSPSQQKPEAAETVQTVQTVESKQPSVPDSGSPSHVSTEPPNPSEKKNDYDPRATVAASLLALAKDYRQKNPDDPWGFKDRLEELRRRYARTPGAEEAARLLADWKEPKTELALTGLVAYWPLDEGTGQTTRDYSGKGHDGTLTNNPQWTTGRKGKALSFTGKESVLIARAEGFDFSESDYTVAAWVKTTRGGVILCKTSPSGKWQRDGKSFFIQHAVPRLDSHSVGSVSGTIRVSDGEWHHMAVVFQANSKNVSFYVDGQRAGQKQLRVRPDPQDMVVRLGTGFPHAFTGTMDEVCVFGRCLSMGQIRVLMEKGLGDSLPPLPVAKVEPPVAPQTEKDKVQDEVVDKIEDTEPVEVKEEGDAYASFASGFQELIAQQGWSVAGARLKEARESPALVDARGDLDLDAQLLTLAQRAQDAVQKGASRLKDGRAFKLDRVSGKAIVVGEGAKNKVLKVADGTIDVDQDIGQGRITQGIELKSLTPETRTRLARLGLSEGGESELGLALLSWDLRKTPEGRQRIDRHIAEALKRDAPAAQIEHLRKWLSLLDGKDGTPEAAAGTPKAAAPSAPGTARCVVYEPFNYPEDQPMKALVGNSDMGFDGPWKKVRKIASKEMAWGDLPTLGNCISAAGASDAHRTISKGALRDTGLLDDGATLWISFLMSVERANLTNVDMNLVLANQPFTHDKYSKRMELEAAGGGIGVAYVSHSVRACVWTDGKRQPANQSRHKFDAEANSLALVAAKITWGRDGGSDTIEVYVPDKNLDPGPVVSRTTADLDQKTFTTLGLQMKEPHTHVDEIRMGATYADVTSDTIRKMLNGLRIEDVVGTVERDGYRASLGIMKNLSARFDAAKVTAKKVATVGDVIAASSSFDGSLKKDLSVRDGYVFAGRMGLVSSGTTIQAALRSVPRALARDRPEVVRVCIGIADMARNLSPGDFRTGLQDLVGAILDAGAVPVLHTLPMKTINVPKDEKKRETADRSTKTLYALSETVGAFNAAIAAVAMEKNVPLLDAWRIVNVGPDAHRKYFAMQSLKREGYEAINERFLALYRILECGIAGRGAAGALRSKEAKAVDAVEDLLPAKK